MQNRNPGYSAQTVWSPSAHNDYHQQHNAGAGSYYAAATSPLHPDTLMPMKEKDADTARLSMDRRNSIENESWQLGLVIGGQGRVQRVIEGTPAHRAKLVFESQVFCMLSDKECFHCHESSFVLLCAGRTLEGPNLSWGFPR